MADISILQQLPDLLQRLNTCQVPVGTLLERVDEYATNYSRYRNAIPLTIEAKSSIIYTRDQERAWGKIEKWLASDQPYFRLKGSAGAGKTTLLERLLQLTQYNFRFTGTTNKNTKVIESKLHQDASTIYSLLGIRMSAREDNLYLKFPDKLPYIAKDTIVVVDEAHMVGTPLNKFLRRARKKLGFRILYVGDPFQFNPIGEKISPVMQMQLRPENRAVLREVKRFDNELLRLSVRLRRCVQHKRFIRRPIRDDNNGTRGVFVCTQSHFRQKINQLTLADFTDTKIIAWRNATVERYNRIVRRNLGFTQEYAIGDIILLAEPIEINERIVGYIDEEGTITSAKLTEVEVDDQQIPCWHVILKTDVRTHWLYIPSETSDVLAKLLFTKANLAKKERHPGKRSQLWRDFWTTRRKFHRVRYGYAITAHRIMGSTLRRVFVDQQDILSNYNKLEAYRGLYVASSRPQQQLYTY